MRLKRLYTQSQKKIDKRPKLPSPRKRHIYTETCFDHKLANCKTDIEFLPHKHNLHHALGCDTTVTSFIEGLQQTRRSVFVFDEKKSIVVYYESDNIELPILILRKRRIEKEHYDIIHTVKDVQSLQYCVDERKCVYST